jgi:UDP-2,3-diacylglucosamine pyrophosphatase LpxH
VKNAVNYIGEFEKTLVLEAKRNDAHGVICGHIHHAAIHDDFGLRYINCGDWVESCTAIAEHADGRFEIITWTQSLASGDAVEEEEGEDTAHEPVREPA